MIPFDYFKDLKVRLGQVLDPYIVSWYLSFVFLSTHLPSAHQGPMSNIPPACA